MDYLFLVIGLALLLAGANYLVESSVAIAQRAKISNFIIGLTIVGMGTSAPELFVSVSSALSGNGDIAMGNLVGSNIANILLILGVTAVIIPLAIEKEQQRRDIPIAVLASLLVFFLANDALIPGIKENTIGRLDGILLLVMFLIYMTYVIYNKAKHPEEAMAEADEETKSQFTGKSPWLLWPIAIASLVALIYGGNLFLDSAKNLAKAWGMSDAVIAITVVAIGTSLPELITAVVAALKNNVQLALGNVIGSCVFNLLMIAGLAATVEPLKLSSVSFVDYGVMILGAFLLYLSVFTFKKDKLDRVEGAIFLLIYFGYTAYLLYSL